MLFGENDGVIRIVSLGYVGELCRIVDGWVEREGCGYGFENGGNVKGCARLRGCVNIESVCSFPILYSLFPIPYSLTFSHGE